MAQAVLVWGWLRVANDGISRSEAGVLEHDASAKEPAKVQRWKHNALGKGRRGGVKLQEA